MTHWPDTLVREHFIKLEAATCTHCHAVNEKSVYLVMGHPLHVQCF